MSSELTVLTAEVMSESACSRTLYTAAAPALSDEARSCAAVTTPCPADGAARRGVVGLERALQVGEHRRRRIAVRRRRRTSRSPRSCRSPYWPASSGRRTAPAGRRPATSTYSTCSSSAALASRVTETTCDAARGGRDDVGDLARIALRAGVRDVARDDRRLRRVRDERGVDDVEGGRQTHRLASGGRRTRHDFRLLRMSSRLAPVWKTFELAW